MTATILVGDVRDQLATLADNTIDCVITSPPYWGLRDYGTGEWRGGHPGCDHEPDRESPSSTLGGGKTTQGQGRIMPSPCTRCGATRTDQQLGLEPTPDQYVHNMTQVFAEIRRVLADHGTCWVNLGDSYWNGGGEKRDGGHGFVDGGKPKLEAAKGSLLQPRLAPIEYLKPKDLVGIPWRVALALQADGWWLRSDIIWSKPNPMPESVTDRPTKAHEYVFLLTKQARYFYDADAVREPHTAGNTQRQLSADKKQQGGGGARGSFYAIGAERFLNPAGRNLRSVWTIPTYAYPEAHFATYPTALVERAIKAGCPRHVCQTCGQPRTRVVEIERTNPRTFDHPHRTGNLINGGIGNNFPQRTITNEHWTDCGHNNYRPGHVLDPFLGSGTTAVVALRNHLHATGIELNPDYAQLAKRRIDRWWDDPTRTPDTNPDQLTLIPTDDDHTPKSDRTPRNDGARWNTNPTGAGFPTR